MVRFIVLQLQKSVSVSQELFDGEDLHFLFFFLNLYFILCEVLFSFYQKQYEHDVTFRIPFKCSGFKFVSYLWFEWLIPFMYLNLFLKVYCIFIVGQKFLITVGFPFSSLFGLSNMYKQTKFKFSFYDPNIIYSYGNIS